MLSFRSGFSGWNRLHREGVCNLLHHSWQRTGRPAGRAWKFDSNQRAGPQSQRPRRVGPEKRWNTECFHVNFWRPTPDRVGTGRAEPGWLMSRAAIFGPFSALFLIIYLRVQIELWNIYFSTTTYLCWQSGRRTIHPLYSQYTWPRHWHARVTLRLTLHTVKNVCIVCHAIIDGRSWLHSMTSDQSNHDLRAHQSLQPKAVSVHASIMLYGVPIVRQLIKNAYPGMPTVAVGLPAYYGICERNAQRVIA
jgi:hypothetical protein